MKAKTWFVPQLIISSGVKDIQFYTKAFGAIELRRWSNDDGSVHVAELSIDGAMFHLHEEKPSAGNFSPAKHGGTTVTVGLMVEDPHAVVEQALAAGATIISPVQDYDYNYRQGEIADPFGHRWLIEKQIS